nr:putative small nuclear ribonucleoprotein E [Cryptomonas sp.]
MNIIRYPPLSQNKTSLLMKIYKQTNLNICPFDVIFTFAKDYSSVLILTTFKSDYSGFIVGFDTRLNVSLKKSVAIYLNSKITCSKEFEEIVLNGEKIISIIPINFE